MRYKFFPILFVIILFQSALFSQNRYSLSQFSDETVQFFKQPVKWESNDWLKLGLVSAGTLLLMEADQPIRDIVLKNQGYYKSFPMEAGRFWGEGIPTAIIAGAFGLHGIMANDLSSKKIAYEVVQSALYAGAITTFLKIAIGRARPFTNRGSATYHPLTFFDDDFHSFPSGHVTLAFSLSTVLANNTTSDFLKIFAYLPAVMTFVSRVYQDNHWTSDAFLGAAIGYVVGNWVSNLHDEKNTGMENVSLSPLAVRIAIF